MKEILNGVYKKNNRIYTRNLTPGNRTYGEELIEEKGIEYRNWNPNRSKLAAAIKNNLKTFPINSKSIILYLGIASGTTASHLSDISKMIYGIDVSPRVLRDLIPIAQQRGNIAPMLQDASQPDQYSNLIPEVDILYQDVSHRKQAEIFIKNTSYLKKGGYGFITIKARSIDVTKPPKEVYKEVKQEIKTKLKADIIEEIELSPFEKDHKMIVIQKRKD